MNEVKAMKSHLCLPKPIKTYSICYTRGEYFLCKYPYGDKFISDSCQIEPNIYHNYNFPIDLASNGIPFRQQFYEKYICTSVNIII